MILEINGKRYRRLKTIWNRNFDWDNPVVDVCDMDKWVMINGVEYEELND